MNRIRTLLLVGLALVLVGCGQASPPDSERQPPAPTSDANEVNVQEVALDAFIYGFPLVMNLKTV